MSIKSLIPNYLILGIVLPIFFVFASPKLAGAQRIPVRSIMKAPSNTGRILEKSGSRAVRREVLKKKSKIRNTARKKAQDMKRLPREQKGGAVEEEYDPTLSELIGDEQAKRKIEDQENQTRFVNLFGQWWIMPSEYDMKAELSYQQFVDSIRQIDSSMFRVPKIVRDDQFVTIFAWHPHFNGKSYKSYNYRLLTAIAYYSYDVDPFTGSYLDSNVINDFLGGDTPEEGIVPTAHANDCKVLLSISSHSEDNNEIFLDPRNPSARQNLIDEVLYLLDTSKADGVELNFENIPLEYKAEFNKFVKRFSQILRSTNPNYAVCVSVPAYDPVGIYDLGRLRTFIDFFIIKGFDYHLDPSEPLGIVKKPVAPLNFSPASGEPDLRSTLEQYIADIGPYHANRLILALPNYGTLWESTDEGQELIANVPYNDVMYDFAMRDSSAVRLDSNYYSFVWTELDTLDDRSIIQRELFYDDVASYRIKFRFLQKYGLGGVGVWPLGYSTEFDGLWRTLEEEFTTIEMPEIAALARINEGSKHARSASPVILTVLLFWAIFAAAGFCMSLFNATVRRALFGNGRFRMYFLVVFSVLILALGSYFGLFAGKTSMLMVGVVLGSFFAYGVIVILNKQRAKAP